MKPLIALFFVLSLAVLARAQNADDLSCVSQGDIDRMVAQLKSNSRQNTDKKLQSDLVDLKKDTIDRFREKAQARARENRITKGVFGMEDRLTTLEKTLEQKRDKSEDRLCEIFRVNGWPTVSMVGEKGTSALFYVLKNFTTFETQAKLITVISAAIARQEVPLTEDYASFLDRLRLRFGLKQLFGTQVYEKNGFLVMAPIQSSEQIDAWRKKYKMPPLGEYLKFLESTYQLPSIRELNVDPPQLKSRPKLVEQTQELSKSSVDSDDTIRVDSSVVELTVRVLSKDFRTNVGGLEQKQFRVFENGIEQPIAAFSKSAQAFDIVLLLDLSGSTALKQGLIRKSAARFIEAARSGDRIAIVTFTHRVNVIAQLSADRALLKKRLDKVGDVGGSYVWDSLKFTVEKMFDKDPARRRAVVMMSDGVDNVFLYSSGFMAGSRTSFAELVESIRASDVSVVPIYLDTEDKTPCAINSPFNCTLSKRAYSQARNTLNFLAEESGGQFYYAEKFEDLDGVYERVLDDLSTGYGIAYQPTDANRDGKWRSIRVEVVDRPDVAARTRRGYYAR